MPLADSRTQLAKLRRFQIAGLPAADLAATTRDRMYVDLTWIAHRGRVFRVTGVCQDADRGRYRPLFEQTAATFRPLKPEDRARIVETRLRMRPARAGETVAEVTCPWSGSPPASMPGRHREAPSRS